MAISVLSSTQRYAAGVLLAMALRQAQIHQTRPLGSSFPSDEEDDDHEYLDSKTQPWTSQNCGLLRPVLRFLDVDSKAWPGIEETAVSSTAKHHIGAFLRILSEENDGRSSENMDQELALAKAVDAMTRSLETSPVFPQATGEKHSGCEHQPYDKSSTQSNSEVATSETFQLENSESSSSREDERHDDKSIPDGTLSDHWKVAVLYELLSACVADTPENDKRHSPVRQGYDARHRVAFRLLATWLDVKWISMEAMEIIVACSAMAAAKEKQAQEDENEAAKSKWSKWKRRGIIGAAAVTGGTLLAITGGLAAPAIAAGFGALAPTLGTLVPVIGASGFAAVATAAGSVAGSVAVAASFGDTT